MSIGNVVHWRVNEGLLFPLLPKAAGSAPLRAMYVTKKLWDLLRTSHEDPELEDRIGHLQADLEVFVESPSIDPKYLFLLYPTRDAVWEIRSTRPDPSIRVLGNFADRDVFIATHCALREELGGWESRQWKEVKRTAASRWRQLFHTYEPRKETDVKALVTGALDGKYFKTRA